jgi:hypothetical protein
MRSEDAAGEAMFSRLAEAGTPALSTLPAIAEDDDMPEGSFTRNHPSPRYQALMQAYQDLHANGSAEQGIPASAMFPGQSLTEHVGELMRIVREFGVRTMLDYGCGKAMLYRPVNDIRLGDGRTFSCVQELLGVEACLYDPAYLPYRERPQGRYDLVVCTDVLEHCAEEDLPWIIDDLFAYAGKALYANIACYPAKKTLPSGENAHCTVRGADWWEAHIRSCALRYPHVRYRFVCTSIVEDGRVNELIDG